MMSNNDEIYYKMTMHHADLRVAIDYNNVGDISVDGNNDIHCFDTDNAKDECLQSITGNNKELNRVIPNADIIIFQFVLHENASFLVDNTKLKTTTITKRHLTPTNKCQKDSDTTCTNENSHFGGALGSILESASVGTIVICTDAANFLWPSLKGAASHYGWLFVSDKERKERIPLGPKSYILLKRVVKHDV
eukprot:11968416-Ditylum_brightwellii.AAC.1